jgi:pimeloyl-ACP methyl ester carboxylesterase
MGVSQHGAAGIEPFRVHASPAELADLRGRLRATRWPDAPEDAGWSPGTDLTYLRELIAYWAEGFDWPAQETALARLPRFHTRVRDLGVAFLHGRGVSAAGPPLPLILCHGWPDSSWRYEKVLPLLTDPGAHGADPADAFDLVVPDMPGFGHSDRRVLDSIAVAGLWAELMTVLGYPRFGAAGGDIGSGVSRYLALNDAERVVAVHRMEASLPVATFSDLAPREREFLDDAAAWKAAEGAYADMHRTKALLTRYWLTGTIGSSMRMYAANAAIPVEQHKRRVEVPSGFTHFPGDTLRPPRAWLERTANVVRLTEFDRGGHFAPFEDPELYARELREFFRPYRRAVRA